MVKRRRNGFSELHGRDEMRVGLLFATRDPRRRRGRRTDVGSLTQCCVHAIEQRLLSRPGCRGGLSALGLHTDTRGLRGHHQCFLFLIFFAALFGFSGITSSDLGPGAGHFFSADASPLFRAGVSGLFFVEPGLFFGTQTHSFFFAEPCSHFFSKLRFSFSTGAGVVFREGTGVLRRAELILARVEFLLFSGLVGFGAAATRLVLEALAVGFVTA